MAEDGGAERSHEPTPRRIEKAREEGRILVSKDAAVCATFAAAVLALHGLTGLAGSAGERLTARLAEIRAERFETLLPQFLSEAAGAILLVSLAAALPAALAAVAIQAATGGLFWVPRNVAPRAERLDPVAGLGRMVSLRALMELGKSLLKVAALGLAAAAALHATLPDLPGLQSIPHAAAGQIVAQMVFALLHGMTLALLLVAGADLVMQARQHRQSLRMTLEEVRREAREENGAPELKARQRRLQAEAARRAARDRAGLAEVHRATAIITNPTHFAVALRYVAGETAAPVILARGADAMARRIIAAGQKAQVPVVPMPPLARALYFAGETGRPIPEALFAAVAAVLAHLWRIERGYQDRLAEVELPKEMQFSPEGRRRA